MMKGLEAIDGLRDLTGFRVCTNGRTWYQGMLWKENIANETKSQALLTHPNRDIFVHLSAEFAELQ